MPSLAETVKRVRVRLGKSQADFATLLGVRRNTVTRYEMGRIVPSFLILVKLNDLAVLSEKEVFASEIKRQFRMGAAVGLGRDVSDVAMDASLDDLRPLLADMQKSIGALERLGDIKRPPMDWAHPGLIHFGVMVAFLLDGLKHADPSILEILGLWQEHRGDRKAVRHFREAAARLREQLDRVESSDRKRR